MCEKIDSLEDSFGDGAGVLNQPNQQQNVTPIFFPQEVSIQKKHPKNLFFYIEIPVETQTNQISRSYSFPKQPKITYHNPTTQIKATFGKLNLLNQISKDLVYGRGLGIWPWYISIDPETKPVIE